MRSDLVDRLSTALTTAPTVHGHAIQQIAEGEIDAEIQAATDSYPDLVAPADESEKTGRKSKLKPPPRGLDIDL